MSGRWRWAALSALIVAVLAAAAALVAVSGGARTTAPKAVAVPPRQLPLGAVSTTAPVPEPGSFAAALASYVRDPAFGGHLSGEVVDAGTGRQLFARQPELPLAPASTVKLLTAVAALSALGPEGVLTTGVVRSGTTLYLVGGGDVTLGSGPARATDYPAVADLGELATRTVTALGTTHRVRLCVDTTAWQGPATAPGWRPGYVTDGDIAPLSPLEVDEGRVRPGHSPRVGDPALAAATTFAAALEARRVDVTGSTCRGAAPSSGFGVAAIASPRVDALVQRMLTDSDNDLAEALGRAVARHAGRPGSFAGAAQAVVDQVRTAGVDVTGVVLHDASGLSRLDRVPARVLVELLQVAVSPQHPELRAAVEGLPVAGFTGTLADRYRRPPAVAGAGLTRAKTGTLAGVNALAGLTVDAAGRLLVFAFITDTAVGPDATEAALDRLAARIAAYR